MVRGPGVVWELHFPGRPRAPFGLRYTCPGSHPPYGRAGMFNRW